MNSHESDPQLLVLLVGAAIVIAILVKSGLERICVPALVGYIVIGFLIRLADEQLGFLSEGADVVFGFLAKLGVIVLLFRIGLESKASKLLKQLRRASIIWSGGVLFSGLTGFLVASYLVGLALIPSVIIGIALTATSVGVSVGVWQEGEMIGTETGEVLIDVAEMDDISGIILMALLFAVVPVLKQKTEASIIPILAKTAGLLLLKLLAIGAFCTVFSLYLEPGVTNLFQRIESPPSFMLTVAGIGIIMAAIAGWLGFSMAVGAFFAGLSFSRDPDSVKIDASFESVYGLFSPFFFIHIGLSIDANSMTAGIGIGLALMAAAILGKLLGHGLPAAVTLGWSGGLLIGLSMIPRAEIAMVIMQKGLGLGEWAVPPDVFAAMVFVSAATCLTAPIVVRSLLQRWPQQ